MDVVLYRNPTYFSEFKKKHGKDEVSCQEHEKAFNYKKNVEIYVKKISTV